MRRLHSVFVEALKVNPATRQEIDRVLGVGVHVQVELEVELPSADIRRKVTLLIGEGDADLDNFEHVHVAPQGLVDEL